MSRTTELKLFTIDGGYSALRFSRHKPNQTPLIKNFILQDSVLARRNRAIKKANLASNDDTICYTFNIQGENYLLHISAFPAGGAKKRVKLVVIDEQGRLYNPTYLFKGGLTAYINEYLTFPATKSLKETFKAKQLKDRVYIINLSIKVASKRDFGDINNEKATKYLNNYLYWAKESNTPPYKYIVETGGGGHVEKVDSSTVEVAKYFEVNLPDTTRYQNVLQIDSTGIRSYTAEDSFGNQASSLLHMNIESMEELPFKFDTQKYIRVYTVENDGLDYYRVWRYDHILHQWVIDYETRYEPSDTVYMKKVSSITSVTVPSYPDAPYWVFEVMEAKEKNKGGYYVEYDRGAWRECAKPSEDTVIYPETLPFQLFKKGSDFYLDTIQVNKKKSTTPNPPFIDKEIQDIFLYNNRLGFVTHDSVTLSAILEDKKPINLFYTTAKVLLPNDPHYIGISDNRGGKIKAVSSFSQGFYIFSEDGIFFSQSQLQKDFSENISVRRITNMNVGQIYARGDIVFFITHNRLYSLVQGQIKEIGEHFRKDLTHIVDVAYNSENRTLYLLKADKKTVYSISSSGACYPLEFKETIHAIETIDTKLVLCKDTGVYSVEVVEQETTLYRDDDGDFQSIVQLPKNVLGDGDNLLRYFYKRFSLYPIKQEYLLRVEKYPHATITNRVDKTNNKAVISTDNQTGNIYIESVEDKPLEVELVEMTIERAR